RQGFDRLNVLKRARVPGQLRVGCHEGDALDERLGEQQAVERIFVQKRQAVDVDRVLAGDRKLGVTIVQQPAPQQPRLDAEVIPTQRILDGDLPEAGRAEQQLVAGVVEQGERRLRQSLRRAGGPEQELRVQQELHSWVPNSAAISASPIR